MLCIIIIIMANEMKSSYSLNSFKLFIVVWALCLTISKMPVKSFILSDPLCIRIQSVCYSDDDGDGCSKRDDCRFNLL